MLRSYCENSTQPLDLVNFLSFYNIERDQFYKNYSFRKLLFNAGITDNYQSSNEKELKSALRRFARVDSRRFLLFAKRLLEEGTNINNLNQADRKLLSMFRFTIWGDVPKENFEESLRLLKEDNQDLVLELKELIDYNLRHQRVLEKPYEVEYVPLDIHASENHKVLFFCGKRKINMVALLPMFF